MGAAVTVTVPTTPTAATRSVEVSQGAKARGVVAGCTSANCHYLRVNFEPGTYNVYCRHDGVAGYRGGVPVLLSSLSGGLGQGVGFVGLVVGGLGFEHGEDDVAASSGDADDGGVVAFAF